VQSSPGVPEKARLSYRVILGPPFTVVVVGLYRSTQQQHRAVLVYVFDLKWFSLRSFVVLLFVVFALLCSVYRSIVLCVSFDLVSIVDSGTLALILLNIVLSGYNEHVYTGCFFLHPYASIRMPAARSDVYSNNESDSYPPRQPKTFGKIITNHHTNCVFQGHFL
jgi:hypothetical protein